MSAFRSSTLRLRTAAMKLPKWPLARPALDLDLHQARERHRLGFSLGIELAVDDRSLPRDGRCCRPSDPWKRAGLQAADLEDELGVAVVHDADLGVGRLALVAIAEPAAQAEDGLGKGRAGAVAARARGRDQPAGDVHLVDALVADVAVAEVPEPVPVVMDQVGVIRLLAGPGRARCRNRAARAGVVIGLTPMLPRGL